jgi:AraC-like DNA-binding protein
LHPKPEQSGIGLRAFPSDIYKPRVSQIRHIEMPASGLPLIEVTLSAFTFFAPKPALADLVETIWDIDLPEAHSASAMTFSVLPAISPTLCLHYRAPAISNQRINPGNSRQRVTGVQTGAITIRPTGPVGAIIVHLRPESAIRFVGGQMDALTDANVGFSDLFGPTETSLLEQMLGEATGAARRAQYVQEFVTRHLSENRSDVVVRHAISLLRRTPNKSVRQLAAQLDISERQLSRRFHAIVGTSVKRFARVARFGRVIAAGRQGVRWAEVAQACGYVDQAHMIHDFRDMAGRPPDAIIRMGVQHRALNGALAASGFYNTVVT